MVDVAALDTSGETQHRQSDNFWIELLHNLRRNRSAKAGALILGVLIFIAVFAPVIATHDPLQSMIGLESGKLPRKPPCIPAFGCEDALHWLGLDLNGRDVFSRVVFGARVSLLVGVTSVIFAIVAGVLLGLFAGYGGIQEDRGLIEFGQHKLTSKSWRRAFWCIFFPPVGVWDRGYWARLGILVAIPLGGLILMLLSSDTVSAIGVVMVPLILAIGIPVAITIMRVQENITIGVRVIILLVLMAIGFAVAYGLSLVLAIVPAIIAIPIIGLLAGIPVAAVIALLLNYPDDLIMRVMDVLLAFPGLLLAITLVTIRGPGLQNALIAISIVFIPVYARLTRASVLSVKETEFIVAERALGASSPRIIFRHILPHALTPLIVQATLGIGTAILDAAALSFLGLGAQPPIAEWGQMLSEGRSYVFTAPHLVFFPGFAIMLTVLGFNLLGDGLRDALDPRLNRN